MPSMRNDRMEVRMTDRELFEWLKREGECWHGFIPYGGGCTCGYPITEKSSLIMHLRENQNPNFLSPDWNTFGWVWDRAKEKEWWPRFLNERYYAKECWDRMEDIDCDHVISTEFINPQRFHAALVEFLEAQGIGRKG